MNFKKGIKLSFLILTISCISAVTASAQGPGSPGEPTETPIDGGASLIAIAAAGYGAKKMLKKKKENLNEK